jgi:hypothetical protein
MKIKYGLFLLLLLFKASCSVDYDIRNIQTREPDCIVVNAYLSPNKSIQIQLHESRSSGNNFLIRGLTNAHVVLKEDKKMVFDGLAPDSLLVLDYFPKAGANYSIEVSCADLPTVSAQTYVPKAMTVSSKFLHQTYWDTSEYLFYLDTFKYDKDEKVALWITSYQLYEAGTSVQYNEIYANNILIDKANSVAGMGAVNETVGSIYYNGFLRVKYTNIPKLSEIVLTPNYVQDGADYVPEESPQNKIQVRLITASLEYDKYNKTLYDQKFMIIYDNDISSVFYQPKGVYNNIKNGFGIFAGMNEVNYIFELPI